MRPTNKIVRDVKDVLNFEGHVDRELLVELANEYSQACDNAVERAYRCRQLLQKGMRHEAMALARQAPDFRREFQSVDFGSAPAWYEFCEQEGLRLPPLLESEVIAGIIDEVYAESADLYRQLMLHRRMALARAPLAERLRVLRSICRADPNDGGWRAEILNYEAARLEELGQQAKAAAQVGDQADIESILDELRSEQWLSLPPDRVVAEVEQIAQGVRQRLASEQVERLWLAIRTAHASSNRSECSRLLEEIGKLIAEGGVLPGEALTHQLEVIKRWTRESPSGPEESDCHLQSRGGRCGDTSRDIPSGPAVSASSAVPSTNQELPLLPEVPGNRLDGACRRRRIILVLAGITGVLLLAVISTVMAVRWWASSANQNVRADGSTSRPTTDKADR